ncbi:cytochrome P450 2J6-like isoform X2 [Pelobates fuscus]|uniref:cytochrome P450 2J6-like isoform X2 n=1 Tax=Pelobates fuscus TaxID=191477 RepID=UPI002FE45C76
MELSTVLFLVLVLLGYLWWKVTRPKSFPPGPLALPIVGNLLQLDFSNFLKSLKEFSKVYGPVYSIFMGSTPVVFVRGLTAMKDVLVVRGLEFADRPQNKTSREFFHDKGLVMAPYGRAWKEHRRFTLSTLRDFGVGKNSMEEKIANESVYLIQEFKKNQDILYDPHYIVDNAVSNIICYLVFGRRYKYDDNTFRTILNIVHEQMTLMTSFWGQLYTALEFIKYLPLPHRKLFSNIKTIYAFLGNVLEEHKRSRIVGEPRDYIDCYLEELEQEKKESNNKQTFGNQNLFSCLVDLFVAGTETTSASLKWALLYMMAFPDIQEKCRNEIDKVRGDRERLDYGDRVSMPYTQAVLQEVQRFTTIVPLGVAHSTQKSVELNGFTIPKGTFIMTDLSSLHSDETCWKYPHEFNPENFLNDDGELLKAESFLPFSAGPRSCLGENLARMEIFLFFTAFLTHFEFHCSDPTSPPDLTPVFGITHVPKRFKMRLVSRC